MLENLLYGKRKIIALPVLAILSYYFLPFLVGIIMISFAFSNIRYSTIKYLSIILIALFAFPMGVGWFSGMTKTIPELSKKTVARSLPTATPEPVTTKPTNAPTVPTEIPTPTKVVTTPTPIKPQKTKTTRYSCDCNKSCTQISSCSEAQYQLAVCGCIGRDGDRDGIACENTPLNCKK